MAVATSTMSAEWWTKM